MQSAPADHLRRMGIRFEVKPHSIAVFTSIDAAMARGVRVSQIVKTMIAEGEQGTIYVAMVSGDRTLKIDRLRRVAQDRSITLFAPGELERRFGLTVGAISPLQFLRVGTRFFMDRSVLAEEMVDISSGLPEAGIELSPADLCRVLDPVMCDIASGPRQLGKAT